MHPAMIKADIYSCGVCILVRTDNKKIKNKENYFRHWVLWRKTELGGKFIRKVTRRDTKNEKYYQWEVDIIALRRLLPKHVLGNIIIVECRESIRKV